MTICEQVGGWAAGLALGDVPGRVRERAELQTAAMLAAARAGEREAAPFAAAAPDGAPGEIYRGAAASIAHDWDDYLFMGHTGHSSVWTARAYAPNDPERALLAQIVGNEVAGRLGAALFLGPHNGQFWASIHCAGAAAAAAVAQGLDADRTAHAIAISLYQPPYGLWPGFMGPATKLLTAAEPAAQGARAAQLAAEGVDGPLDVIEHPRGLLTNMAFVRRPRMLGGLGRVWLTDTLAFKPRPGCAYLQAAVEAALTSELTPSDVAAIDIEAGLLTVAMEELAPADAVTPVGVNFSAARSVAIALIAGSLTHEQLDPSWLSEHRAEVEELAARIRVRHDWELTLATVRGSVDAGASAPDVTASGWLRVLRRTRELGMPEVIDGRELRRLLARGDVRSELWRLLRARGGGTEALDTARLRMTFPCRLRIRLRSGRVLTLDGDERGASGRPVDEQRRVVEEKCRLVGLESPVGA